MLPVIAIVGRPNVGKSTLFNRLTKSRDALVANMPGLTRDRQYGQGKVGDKAYIVIDTGGISGDEVGIDAHMARQSKLAMEEADSILFLFDAREGLNPIEQNLAGILRQQNKPIYIVVNKTDGLDETVVLADFYALGLGEPLAIAAEHGRGIPYLMQQVCQDLPDNLTLDKESPQSIKIAIIGRPNVGKSTLINRMLGEDRVVVYDQPGTTRDSIFLPLERHGQHYTLVDTAGVRRRKRVQDAVEKFSIIKALQAIAQANVVINVLDAQEGITDQDLHLIGFALDAGRSLVIAINKWDGLQQEAKQQIKEEIERRLLFVNFARLYFISALHGTGVGNLYEAVGEAYNSATQTLSTAQLTETLQQATTKSPPSLVRGRRIKLRYAHSGGRNPPVIVIHGNQTGAVPTHYKRYLVNFFRQSFNLVGTPIRLEFKSSDNPYKDRRNTLTPRQQAKRKRAKKLFK